MIIKQTHADRFHERRIAALRTRMQAAADAGDKNAANKWWRHLAKQIGRRSENQIRYMEQKMGIAPGTQRGFRA